MRVRALILVTVVALFGGCVHPGYFAQAARGQWALLRDSRPLGRAVQDESEPLYRRRVLSRIHEIRAFGRSRGLNMTRSYQSYVRVRDEAVVWVVQASAPLAFEPREWSFPLLGSVPYLGFFDRAEAESYAKQLSDREKLDVAVRGAGAYSTLGWLDDPVLSSMIPDRPDAMGEFANVILHESVHATVYVGGQSTFNESLASFVADHLTEEWLTQTFGAQDPLTRVWIRYQDRYRDQGAKLRNAWIALDAVYRSGRSDEEKLAEKARIISALQKALRSDRPINNALLSGYKTYDAGSEAFGRLFTACGRSWQRFLSAVGSLKGSDFPEPQAEAFDAVLERLASQRCR